MTKRAAFLSCLLAAALARAAAEPPLVQAKLFRIRGGLGNVFAKLAGGGEVKIAYFGGSITAAAGWRVKTLGWFRETWPAAKVKEIHAAIGGTGSDLGAFRCHKDVIAHKPDLVFIEFAVNDGGAKPDRIHQTIEGIVRQIWRANPRTDICFVYTYRIGYEKALRRGLCPRAASADERIAEHYGIPSINVALRIVELERDGKLVFTVPRGQQGPGGKLVFSHDSCHPTGPGHDIYRDVIAAAFTEFQKQSKPGPHTLPKPFAPDNWEDARLAAIQPAMLTGSWKKMDTAQGLGRRFHSRLPVIWHGGTPGDKLTFKFKGTLCRMYDLVGPNGGIAILTVDGKKAGERKRFDWYCIYWRLQTFTVAAGLDPNAVHTVTLEISPQQPDREPVLKRVRDQKGFDPKKYDGTNLWLGYVMLRGELVK